MLYFIVFVVGIICGRIISFMVEENRKIQRLKNPKTYTLDEVEAELGLTAEKKGKWLPNPDDTTGYCYFVCSACGSYVYDPSYYYYCPNCGARMEESE